MVAIMGVDFTKSRNEDIHHLFEVLEGKLRVIEPLPEPPRGAIGTELGTAYCAVAT